MPSIILSTLNARYIHASLGLRYLLANLGSLREQAVLREFTIARAVQEIADELLAALTLPTTGEAASPPGPPIIGFGVYIWNVRQTTDVIRRLREKRPELRIVLGGPEVSHEQAGQLIIDLADHVISGPGEAAFPALCRRLAAGEAVPKFIVGEVLPLAQINLPYEEYSDADLRHRLLYVEASRGCPFQCEFCLSSLDNGVQHFDTARFLAAMHRLYQRGARNFKFVDRTFNLKTGVSERILQFFLARLEESPELFLHFEMVPDRLPERLKTLILRFPPGVLQFEIGIQTMNSEVQQRISRQQNEEKTLANLRWLVECGRVHIHADLIFGLPGETLESLAEGFNRLYALQAHEIQLGFLKRLRGTPIRRHTDEFGMVYDAEPPCTVQATSTINAATMQRLYAFARLWDRIANSGRFRRTLVLLLDAASPFDAFLGLADRFQAKHALYRLSLEALVDALHDDLLMQGFSGEVVLAALLADYQESGARGSPQSLKHLRRHAVPASPVSRLTKRQEHHAHLLQKKHKYAVIF